MPSMHEEEDNHVIEDKTKVKALIKIICCTVVHLTSESTTVSNSGGTV